MANGRCEARFDSALRARLSVSGAVLVLALLASPARADDFGGVDKALHFGASFGISAAAYTGAALLHAPTEGRLTAAIALALAAGVGKELLDVRGLGDPSPYDLAWDVIGTVTGAVLTWLVDWLFFTKPVESPAR